MSKITGLRLGKSREKLVNVFLDGRSAFSLKAGVAVKEGLEIGQELSTNRIELLVRSERFRRCLGAATRYLSYRPRSEAEVREKLKQRGFDDDSIKAVLAKLKEQGLVDDVAFAEFWKENRESFRPRSQRLTALELGRKGVASEIVNQVVGTVDDSGSAYRAALSKAARLPLSDYSAFRRRLWEYLRRRGFSFGVINQTVEFVWRERGSPAPPLEDNFSEGI